MTVHGERSKDNQNRKRYITEFSDYRFHRTFAIPSNVNVEQVDAEYVNGILTVELPYLEKKEKSVRSISIR
jgi:HSP20 family protein